MRVVLVICVALGLACSKKTPSSDAVSPDEAKPAAETESEETLPKQLQEPAPPADAAPVVTLLDPGQGKRSELRLSVAPGSKQRLSLEVRYTAEASVGGTFPVQSPLQLAKYDLTLEANEKSADRGVRVELSVDEVSLIQGHRGKSKERQKRTRAVIKTMKALTGDYTVTPTGKVTGIELDVPPDAPRLVYDLTDNLRWALLALMPSLPEEPVGEGATWSSHRGLSVGGIELNQLSTHELVKRDGTEVQIRTTPLQGGVTQTFKNPGTRKELELLEVRSDVCSEEVTWDLTSLAPRSATIKNKLATVVQIKPSPDAVGRPPMQSFIVTDRSADVPAP